MGYLHNRGDYGRYRGDPGILDVFRKIGGTALGVVGQMVPGPAGAVMRQASAIVKPRATTTAAAPRAGVMPAVPRTTLAAPSGGGGGTVRVNAAGEVVQRRRRMNVGNAKALRRAIRRQQGFVKLAKKALKGTGYKITRAGSSRPRAVSVRETGPGSVNIR